METNVTERVSVVVGGGGEIGGATVEAMAAQGSRVVIADLSHDSAERTAGEMKARGYDVFTVQVDIADEGSVASMIDAIKQHYGRIVRT